MIVGIGTDIIKVDRISRSVTRYGEKFLKRVYTDREIAYCAARKRETEHLAGRFAAKEAALKALGTGVSGGATLRGVEVTNDDSGKPEITLHGGTLEAARERGIRIVHISISHAGEFATAYAVAES